MLAKFMGRISQIARLACCGCLRGYQLVLSPLFGNCCRFYPSCSQYAMEAVKERGVMVGLGLTLWRLARCHPGCKGGFDPVNKQK